MDTRDLHNRSTGIFTRASTAAQGLLARTADEEKKLMFLMMEKQQVCSVCHRHVFV